MYSIKTQRNIIACAVVFVVALLLATFSYTSVTYMANEIAGSGGYIEYEGEDASGAGTKEDPFLIGSYHTLNNEFRQQATMPNKHYVLISDIEMVGNWQPIHSLAEGSVLDGNGFTIHNLNIPTSIQTSSKGLFATLNGSVKNLFFTNVNIQGSTHGTHIGVIAGESAGRNITIDNVRVESGTMSTSATMSMAGGFVGRLFGSGISNNNRANFTIQNSYTKMSNIQAYNGVAGFIGFVQSGNININIKNSFHIGNMHASNVYVGGAIGGVSNTLNKTITIENTYAQGRFTATNYVGGMLGYFNAQAYPTPELFINNCFSQITTTNNNSTKGGIFGQATNGGGVFINNCVAVNGSGITRIGGNQASIQQSELTNSSFLNTQEMADRLNDGANPPNYVIYENRLELRAFDPRIMLVFNSNGGTFQHQESIEVYDLFRRDDFMAQQVSTPYKVGYNFIGWNTMADGSGENYINEDKINTADNLTLYANWQIISYKLQSAGGNTQGQIVSFHNEDNDSLNDVTLHQDGYIKTHLNTQDENNQYTFNAFLVLKKEYYDIHAQTNNYPTYQENADAWTNIGSGYLVNNDTPLLKEQRLNFYDTETGYHLINQDFIQTYAIETSENQLSFIFSPVYHITEIHSFTFDVNTPSQKSYGMVYIDDVYTPYGTNLNYIAEDERQIEMRIEVNKYRTLNQIQYTTDNQNFTAIENIHQQDNTYTFTFDLIDGMQFEIEFASVEFDVSIVAYTYDNIPVPIELEPITNNAPDKVYLNSNLSNATARNVDGFRLINNAVNNIKIFNQQTQLYDYFSAINGNINFASLNADFFDKYVDYSNNDGQIVIIAEYVQQFELDLVVDYILEAYGDVTIQITNLQGNTMIVSQSMLGFFDKGSTVRITIEPDKISLIESIDNINQSELNENGNIINFILDKNRNDIKIAFGVKKYTLNVTMLDNNLNEILDIEKLLPEVTEFYIEDEISYISKGEHANYEFLGWYAMVGDTLHQLPPPYHETIENLFISQDFIENYTDELEINIVGKFVKLYQVNIILPHQSGEITFAVLNQQDGGKQINDNTFREGTILQIITMPDSHYHLGEVLGLASNDNVIGNTINITVNSTMFVTIPFNATKYNVVQTNDLKDALGEVLINNTSIALDEQITLTFKPESGYDIRSWKINGIDINQLENAEVSGNNVVLTITEQWLQSYLDNGLQLDSEIKTMMNKTYLTLMLVGGIGIPLLLALIIIVIILSRRRKIEYEKLMLAQKSNERRLASVDFIKNLTKENEDK